MQGDKFNSQPQFQKMKMKRRNHQVFTIKDASKILGIAPVTIRYHCKNNAIGFKLGRQWVLRKVDIDRLKILKGRPGRKVLPWANEVRPEDFQ